MKGCHDEAIDRLTVALRAWSESRAWLTPERDAEEVNRLEVTEKCDGCEHLMRPAAEALGPEMTARVRAASHRWGEFRACRIFPRQECPTRCLKCGVAASCWAEPGAYHYRIFTHDGESRERLPPCARPEAP